MRQLKTKHKKARLLFFGGLVLLLLAGAAVAPHVMPNDPYLVDLSIAKLPPGRQYPFGTDALGRCLLSRIMAGAPSTLFYSLLVVVITFVSGTVLGVLCGYFGGWLDMAVMRIVDTMMAFPGIVLCIAIAGVLGSGMSNAVIALSLTGWTQYTRIARGRVLALREKVFMQASALSGSSHLKIIFRHVVPNTVQVLIVTAAIDVGGTILEMAGLSFLGLGAKTPMAEWGILLDEGRAYLQTRPGLIIFPGIFILLAVMLFNLFGDSVRDYLDPREN